MKKKGDKMVPNCVPEQKTVDELSVNTLNNYRRKASKPNPSHSAAKQDKRYAGVARAGQKLDKKLESTAAYGKSQAAIRAKKQRAGMTSSDRSKMGAVADMMRREREKRAAQHRSDVSSRIRKEEVEEAYTPRAAAAQRSAANKMYGRTSDSPSKPKTTSGLDSKGRMIRDKDPAAARRKAGALSKAIQKKYGTKKEAVSPAQQAAIAISKKERGEKPKNESLNPRDFTDKPGHLVIVKKPSGKQSIKHYHPTRAGAQKYADRVNKTNKVGHKATVHKTDGRLRISPALESSKIHEAMSKVMQDKVRALADKDGVKKMTAADLLKYKAMAKAELKKDKETKKAAPAKPVSKTSKGNVRTGSADPADRNIFMQLRKAQDRGGNQAVTVSPTGKKVTLTPGQIDMLLKRHDSLQKPVDKRKFKIMLIKQLRAKAK